MMKKPTLKSIQRSRLVVRREVIVLLTPLELGRVAGGWTQDWPCDPTESRARGGCAETAV